MGHSTGIRRAEAATNVDNLEPLAAVFGLEPWHLLLPDLHAATGPDGQLVVFGLPDWPFDMVDKGRYLSLHEPNRAYVQAKMAAAIEEREAPRPPERARNSRSEELAKQALLPQTPRSPRGQPRKTKP